MSRKTNRLDSPRQAGFTLVEIAVVLLLVGLLIGGVIKMKEMVRLGKVRKVENMASEIRAAVNAYYQNQGHLPGDAVTVSGVDYYDGWIETDNAFKELAASGFITGDPAAATREHPFGGLVRVKRHATYGDNCIIFEDLPQEVIDRLDEKYDDGQPNSGAFRSSGGDLFWPL